MPVLKKRYADFNDLLKVLRREQVDHPVLFEIFFDPDYYEFFSGKSLADVPANSLEELKIVVEAFHNAGFVYATIHGSEFEFPRVEQAHAKSRSINEGCVIHDWDSFHAYNWMDPDACCYDKLEQITPYLPDNMKLMVMGPGGVLENVTWLIGYDNMCFMLYEEPELLEAVFEKVGSSMLRYYERALEYDSVGVILSNDDWGFNTQTFLSIPHMRKLVFPWHKKIVEAAHKKGKPAILHSCGYMNDVFDDIIDDMKFDAKHSFEDNILSIEQSFARWGDRIAMLGGLDLNFFIQAPMEEVRRRCTALAELAVTKPGYALGSGNSLCYYIPQDKALAMLEIANNYGGSSEEKEP